MFLKKVEPDDYFVGKWVYFPNHLLCNKEEDHLKPDEFIPKKILFPYKVGDIIEIVGNACVEYNGKKFLKDFKHQKLSPYQVEKLTSFY